MTSLKSDIQALRCRVDGDSKYFVPHQNLYKLLTRSAILTALIVGSVAPSHRLDAIADRILFGARRVFAILVVLGGQEKEILRFIEKDNFQESQIDHRLPLSEGDLRAILPSIAAPFYEKQWEFAAPVFTREVEHRLLDLSNILPFVEKKYIDRGGFAEVYRIALHPGHQNLSLLGPESKAVFVLKQFFQENDDTDSSHSLELHNLSLLNRLKHPHILELLASFSYQNKRNLIFPFAEDGDLESLFKKSDRPPELCDDFAFYRCMSQLSSALEKMHGYTISANLDPKVIGLHRDLKPSNILVSKNKFILADFGLSSIKLFTSSSATPFRIGGGDYLAPECEDIESLSKGIAGRASDIWSLGCVLVELLVYMRDGPPGIDSFRKDRVFKCTWTMRTFHGPGKSVNPHVIKLLDEMESNGSTTSGLLIRMIRVMLSVEPSDRPLAAEITRKLQFLAVNELVISLDEPYQTMKATTGSLQANLELERYRSWKYVLGYVSEDQIPVDSAAEFLLDFSETVELLQAAQKELRFISERYEATAYPMFLELRRINDSLLGLLRQEDQSRAFTYLAIRLLDTKDSAFSTDEKDIRKDLDTLGFAKDFSTMISAKSQELAFERERQGYANICLEPKRIEIKDGKSAEDHNLGWFSPDGLEEKRRILVEWIRYDMHWEGTVQKEMITRVASIASFLHQGVSHAPSLRTLECLGYFHSPNRHAFGLVYELPVPRQADCPKSLNDIIVETRKSGVDQICLEDRFRLALELASTLLKFHTGTLVHKNISSYNVIFFSSQQRLIQSPYLIGFNYSRPNEPKAFTTGPPPSHTARKYHHPEYNIEETRNGGHFRFQFDYYSLGLVLLEIGLWDTVSNFKAKSTRDLQQKLLARQVPLLGYCMGSAYRDAVDTCLQSNFGCTGAVDTDMAMVLEFQRLVVDPLRNFPLAQEKR
ncbi:kinase-like protein [Mytilinidion resinicola]|uniref:Kinase-like protein n=1 Tax=Mytilinidion resinicola TaxID=574789 RepID=A0A6A6YJY7_9PEZI|nr:kinase-like protein [Mytilinidion resinicola]KAF2809121.1 kinase-like protein [Mytilinidion resinicola]